MQAEQDAVVTALELGWPQGRTYNIGEVPDLPVTPYRVVSVTAGDPRNYRVGGVRSAMFYRVSVQHFGANVAEVTFASDKTEAGLLDARVAPEYTRCRREVATPIVRDPDGGGVLMVVHTYTFAKH